MDYVAAKNVLENEQIVSERLYEFLGVDLPPEISALVMARHIAIKAIGKQIAKPVKVKDRKYQKDFYCPRCGKQQKLPGVKQAVFGSYCERCGQRLSFPDPKTGKKVEVDETTFVFEFGGG